jgi:hypothetical protein
VEEEIHMETEPMSGATGGKSCLKSAIGISLGLALGALAGIALGLVLGIGIALVLGVL